MFGWVFGDEALLEVIRRLHRQTPTEYERHLLDGSQRLDYAAWAAFCREAVGDVTGPAGERFYDRWFGQAHPLDYAVSDVKCARPIPWLGREEWVLTFTIVDRHRGGAPAGRETVPMVEVAVDTHYGTVIEKISLTDDRTRVELYLPGQPVAVELDPEQWILDFTPTNNLAEVPIPPTPAELARLCLVGLLVLGLGVSVVLWLRSRPVRLGSPPGDGSAR